MPTFKKIPQKIRATGSIASGKYCVFTNLLNSGKVFTALLKAEKKGNIPMVGYIMLNGIKFYYCLYGLVNDPDIYAKN